MKKLNTKEIQNRLAELNEQRQRIENIKSYLLCVVLGFSVLSCYIGEPMFCALVFIVMPAYVTVHIFLNTKIELILSHFVLSLHFLQDFRKEKDKEF